MGNSESVTGNFLVELLDPMRPCRRCKGTGTYWIMSDNPAPCAGCWATGKVPSPRDIRRLNEAANRRYRLLKAMYARAKERDGRRNGDIDFATHQGYGVLEEKEPGRLNALFDSLEAGRIDDVIDSLVAYRNTHTNTEIK